MGAGMEQVGADRFQQGKAHAFLGRRRAGVDLQHGEPRVVLHGLRQETVLGGQEQSAPLQVANDLVPVEVGFREQEHGIGGQLGYEPRRRLQQCNRLMGQRHATT